MLNEDYREMLSLFIENKVEFLIVGAYAMGVHGFPRATGDIDFWINPTALNASLVYSSLQQFGAPLANLEPKDFSTRGLILQVGIAPRRIDIITEIDGVDFDKAYDSKIFVEIDGLNVPVISKKNLIKNKLSTGRKKDQLDAEYLQLDDNNDL